MRKLCTSSIPWFAFLIPSLSAQAAAIDGPTMFDRSRPFPPPIVFLALGLGFLMFLSVPRNFGEAFVSELKHRLGRWIPHV